ncbi:MAG: N-acetyltransferase family protein [Spirochaetia bacterium]|nr:N-acetyltransferase family protein [Spirochaetia bacterium]
MQIMNLGREYAKDMLAIYNEAVLNTTASFDLQCRDLEYMNDYFSDKEAGNFPILGIVEEGTLLGYASYGTFRPRAAYKRTVEVSIYIHKDQRGKGLGQMLLSQLIAKAVEQQYHCMVAAIDAQNKISIYVHQKAGFSLCGVVKEVGYKFDSYRDLVFMQLLLPTS